MQTASGFVVERFEYTPLEWASAYAEVVAQIDRGIGIPRHAALVVQSGDSRRWHVSTSSRRADRGIRTVCRRSSSGLLWCVSFTVPLDVAECPEALFSLTSYRMALTLPKPSLRLPSAIAPAGSLANAAGAMQIRRRVTAVASSLAIATVLAPTASALAAGMPSATAMDWACGFDRSGAFIAAGQHDGGRGATPGTARCRRAARETHAKHAPGAPSSIHIPTFGTGVELTSTHRHASHHPRHVGEVPAQGQDGRFPVKSGHGAHPMTGHHLHPILRHGAEPGHHHHGTARYSDPIAPKHHRHHHNGATPQPDPTVPHHHDHGATPQPNPTTRHHHRVGERHRFGSVHTHSVPAGERPPSSGAPAAATPVPASPPVDPFTAAELQRFSALTVNVVQPPAFLLPIFQAAARRYQIPWQILAAINAIETDYGRDLSVSADGAVGWMQFMPDTWARYGMTPDGHGQPNPYDPRDAIFSAARFLAANGGRRDLVSALFAYNHALWYVDAVLWRAQMMSDHATKSSAGHHSDYALPLDARYMQSLGRTDDGVDIETAPDGAAVYSITPGIVTAVARDPGGFGPNYPVILATAGPLAGRYIYYGHVVASLVIVGQHVLAGQPIAVVGHTGNAASLGHGHIEIGFSDGSGDPLNHGGAVAWTPAGDAMRRVLDALAQKYQT